MSEVIAHARQDSKWHFHPLQNHLKKVAKLARLFAGRYGALFAEYAGLLHDLGKFQEAFQEYIRRVTGVTNHLILEIDNRLGLKLY